jgi:uncharacterized protein (DUF433 family)
MYDFCDWPRAVGARGRDLEAGIGLSDNREMARAITRDPETMHGVPVFSGTRVSVQTLFEYLEGGDTLEDFLEGFTTVSRALAVEALEEAKQLCLRAPDAAADRRVCRRFHRVALSCTKLQKRRRLSKLSSLIRTIQLRVSGG